MTPQEIANAVGAGMMANDKASSGLGMRLTHISPGAAHIDMPVRSDMLNGHKTCKNHYCNKNSNCPYPKWKPMLKKIGNTYNLNDKTQN